MIIPISLIILHYLLCLSAAVLFVCWMVGEFRRFSGRDSDKVPTLPTPNRWSVAGARGDSRPVSLALRNRALAPAIPPGDIKSRGPAATDFGPYNVASLPLLAQLSPSQFNDGALSASPKPSDGDATPSLSLGSLLLIQNSIQRI